MNNNLRSRRPHRESGLRGKWWNYNIGFGGGSNCWWTNAMRIHPEDFELKSRYGVGVDWPVTYDQLERYYCDAEDEMFVSGDNSSSVVFPRSRPFPQLRHRYSDIGQALKVSYPEQTFAMPTTRSRVASDRRGVCCAVGRCNLCPNHAKFTIVEEMSDVFDDPRVQIALGAEVTQIETSAGRASAAIFKKDGAEHRVQTDFVALGANGIFNPFLLLKSGIIDGPVGLGVTEQIPINLSIDFSSVKSQNYSSLIAAVNYSFQNGPHRRTCSGEFMEVNNKFRARPNKEKWNNSAEAVFLLGDLRQENNTVTIDPDNPAQPLVSFLGWSSYVHAGVEHVKSKIESFLTPLGIDHFTATYGKASTHSHIEGTTTLRKYRSPG